MIWPMRVEIHVGLTDVVFAFLIYRTRVAHIKTITYTNFFLQGKKIRVQIGYGYVRRFIYLFCFRQCIYLGKNVQASNLVLNGDIDPNNNLDRK